MKVTTSSVRGGSIGSTGHRRPGAPSRSGRTRLPWIDTSPAAGALRARASVRRRPRRLPTAQLGGLAHRTVTTRPGTMTMAPISRSTPRWRHCCESLRRRRRQVEAERHTRHDDLTRTSDRRPRPASARTGSNGATMTIANNARPRATHALTSVELSENTATTPHTASARQRHVPRSTRSWRRRSCRDPDCATGRSPRPANGGCLRHTRVAATRRRSLVSGQDLMRSMPRCGSGDRRGGRGPASAPRRGSPPGARH